MLPEQVRLVEENHNLIYGFLRKHNLNEDFYGDAAIGLCKAAMNYDSSTGASFSTYAYKCMFNECGIAIRSEKRQNSLKAISIETPIMDNERINLEDVLAGGFSSEHLDAIVFLRWFIEKMGVLDLKILLYRLQGNSFRKIEEKVGFSYQYIKKRVSKFAESYVAKEQLYSQRDTDTELERQTVKNMILEFVGV